MTVSTCSPTMKYSPTLRIENPPLLVAWISLEMENPLDDQAVGTLRKSVDGLGFTMFEQQHQPARMVGDRVSRSLDIWASEGKSRLVSFSKNELYFVAAKPRFADLLQEASSVLSSQEHSHPIRELSLNYYNVFESTGATTNLLLDTFQGPPPREAHEHRFFHLMREKDDTWYRTKVEFLHGDKYRPDIRDRGNGLERYLALRPSFKPDASVDCYGLRLSVHKENLTFGECEEHVVRFKHSIDRMFLESVTEDARIKWQIKS